MIELYVTENKSFDPIRFFRNRVRIFLNKDYNYGLWVDEDKLFDLLTDDQKRQYLLDRSREGMYYQLEPATALKLVQLGHSPIREAKVEGIYRGYSSWP